LIQSVAILIVMRLSKTGGEGIVEYRYGHTKKGGWRP